MKNKIYFLKGLPASGKTTWAKKILAENPDRCIRVNKDDLRAMLHNSRYSKPNEKLVLLVRNAIIIEAMSQGQKIIVDDTNFETKHLDAINLLVNINNDEFTQDETEFEYDVEIIKFDASVEDCILRDSQREKPVGEKVIREMQKRYLTTLPEYDTIVQNQNLPKAIICDLDGTLAIHNNRGPFEYHKCLTDLLNPVIKIMLDIYSKTHRIIYVSGREDCCKLETINWLGVNHCFYESMDLHMRKSGDHRKDTIIKKEIFDAEIKDKYYVEFILDDRTCVVSMWRQLGLTCLQVAEGNF